MAEKMTDKVVRLMKQPSNIRNIGVCAHIDHGKCVSGNSRLFLRDGSVLTAEDLFTSLKSKGKLFERKENQEIYDVRSQNIKIFSLNKDSGKIETKRIDLGWKLQGGELIKIGLRNGGSIETTPEHKYLVLDPIKRDFAYKKAEELKLKDLIVCPRKIKIKDSLEIKPVILRLLSKKRFYAFLDKDYGINLKTKILSYGIDNIQFNNEITKKSFYHGSWKNRYLLHDLLKIADLFNISYEEIYDNIRRISFRSGGHRGKSSEVMKLPKKFEDFFYLAGLFLGDGHSKKFIVEKEELRKKFICICNDLGVSLTYRSYYRTPEIVTSTTLLEILNSLFDYPKRNKSKSIKISDFVFRSHDNLVAHLIRGYFDTDGSVEKNRSAISISSASEKMLDDLHLLLLRFGCPSQKYLHKKTIYISGEFIKSFMDNIGFGLESKRQRAEAIVASQGKCRVVKAGVNIVEDKELLLAQYKNKLLSEDIVYVEVVSKEFTYRDTVYDFTVSDNHNFIAEGLIIHNTTFSDNLLAGAGMISEELAGKQLVLDFRADEQERGITIDAANVSMVHSLDNNEYLINLIDTPGHVDFGGDVTRAMRAVDGAIVLCDAVEGIMPQTETVLRQALRERVKPILFINKVDRLIKEVKLTPEAMQERFVKIINSVNQLIRSLAPEEFKEEWQVNIQDGSVAFGSALHNWALSFLYMQKSGLKFKDVIDAYQNEDVKTLAKKAPLHIIVLNMVIRHHPNPIQAQKYRIPKIWHGDLESVEGKSLLNCDPKGPVAFIVTKIIIDKHAGEVATGRLFSGTLRQSQEVWMNGAKQKVRLQQVSIYKGAQRFQVDEAPAGNIIGLVGLKNTFAGETISDEATEPFEAIKHIFEPVVTKSIESKNASELPKLVEVLKQVAKEDPTIQIEINEETGENLFHGMGELHLEVIENRIRTEKGLDVSTSPPIVVFRETITKKSEEFEGKSPNKHNKFYFVVEPLEDEIYNEIKAGELPEGRIKRKDMATFQKLADLGIPMKEARNFREIFNGNVIIDNTRGIVHIGEVIEMVMDGFEQVMKAGLIAREPCIKIKVRLMDTKLHEDAIHRGPAQVHPAVREGIRGAMSTAKPLIFEPIQLLQIEAPSDYMGEISKLVQNKRGQLINMNQEGVHVTVEAKLPVAEMFGLTSELRSATGGRGNFFVVDQFFEKVPEALQSKIIKQIRDRKGLKEE